jgi:hypothetical protein
MAITNLVLFVVLISSSLGVPHLNSPEIVLTTPNNVSPAATYQVGYTIVSSDITIVTILNSMMKTGGSEAILSFDIPSEYCYPSGDPRGGNVIYVMEYNVFIPGSFELVQSTSPVRIQFYSNNGSTLMDRSILTRQSFQIWRGRQ